MSTLVTLKCLVKKFTYPDEDSRKPPVPRASDKPQMGTQSNKNFVTTNATTTIMSGLSTALKIAFVHSFVLQCLKNQLPIMLILVKEISSN